MTTVWTADMPGAQYVDIYADGKKLENCVSFVGSDQPGVEVEGEVECYSVDKYGSIITISGEVMRTRKDCLVRWEWMPGTPEKFKNNQRNVTQLE